METKDLMIGDYLFVAKDNLCIRKGTIVEIRGIDADDKLEGKNLIGSTHCRPLDKDQFEGGIYIEGGNDSQKIVETYDTEEKFYSEILRRFNELKEKHNGM